jgi:PiT family inorganic phosphate transporter
MLLVVLLAGAAAPLLTGLLAFAASRVGLSRLRGLATTRRAYRLHAVAFTLQCLAYSANGGQKMLAVFALATGATAVGAVRDSWWLALALAALFAVGVLSSLRRVAASLGQGILAVRLRHALLAEACSFAVVFAGGLVGLPLTMSQAVTGALVGAGTSESATRVRWPAAVRMLGAWVVTLPASIGLAALGGALTRWA